MEYILKFIVIMNRIGNRLWCTMCIQSIVNMEKIDMIQLERV